jgi:hypothetical protein
MQESVSLLVGRRLKTLFLDAACELSLQVSALSVVALFEHAF